MSCRGIASLWLAALAVALSPHLAAAQSSRERPTVHAASATEAPRIDGVLDEAVWQSAVTVDTFTQQEPENGAAHC